MRAYSMELHNLLLVILIIYNTLMAVVLAQNGTTPSPTRIPSTSQSPSTNSTAAEGVATPPTRPLRIAVPIGGYSEFVSITKDPVTGEHRFGGFAIEVFLAVINTALSDPFDYKLVPFLKPDGTMNGSYDNMVQAVFAQDYDVAIGDITIRFDRTQWVDFTLPFSDTGITMMVSSSPNQGNNRMAHQIKIMPLIKGLVAAALAFCFLSAFLFWVVEFRNDRHRQSQPQPPSDLFPATKAPDTGEDYWRRETLRAIVHTRLVIVICFLVLLFLSSCYTASLTSLLTSQRQKTPIKTIDELIRKKAKVGSQSGSFLQRSLIQLGFSKEQIIPYDTEEEMITLLSEGKVDAIIEETPYLNVFLSKNCNKGYHILHSINIPGQGFGFAFQKGSRLVREVSNGILKLTDGGQLAKIQHRTIGGRESCESEYDGDDPNFLDMDTMWILLAGAIGVSILVIILYLVYFGTTFDTLRKRLAFPCYLLPNSGAKKHANDGVANSPRGSSRRGVSSRREASPRRVSS